MPALPAKMQQRSLPVPAPSASRGTTNYQQALATYEQGLQIDPNNVEALNGKGATLRALGRDEEALAAFTRATEIDPTSAPSWIRPG